MAVVRKEISRRHIRSSVPIAVWRPGVQRIGAVRSRSPRRSRKRRSTLRSVTYGDRSSDRSRRLLFTRREAAETSASSPILVEWNFEWPGRLQGVMETAAARRTLDALQI